MLILSSTQTQPDYAALAMVLVLLVIVTVMALRKKFSQKTTPAEPEMIPQTQEPQKPVAPGAAGQVKLYDVPDKTAAMLMAIVANKVGKPLNELRFISIKEIN